MHDEPLNHENLSQSAAEHLDQRIVRALEIAPETRIPADFAARVAAQLPERRPVSLTPTHYGKGAMLIGLGVILVALLILATQTRGHAALGLLESLLFAQFIALAVWLSVWRRSLR
jgi:hypothetical protein